LLYACIQVKKEKGPGCVETLSSGLDLNARDARGINTEINVSTSVLTSTIRIVKIART
jgi:hypothetical protein